MGGHDSPHLPILLKMFVLVSKTVGLEIKPRVLKRGEPQGYSGENLVTLTIEMRTTVLINQCFMAEIPTKICFPLI